MFKLAIVAPWLKTTYTFFINSKLPEGPGTLPLTRIKFWSCIISIISVGGIVTLLPPNLPGIFLPFAILEGEEHIPTEPGCLIL